MTDVLIKRELLERIDESAICDGTDATISDDLFTQLVAALSAPRQPEGDGLEAVESLHVWRATNRFGDTCHFGDAGCARVWAGAGGKVDRIELKAAPELYDALRQPEGEFGPDISTKHGCPAYSVEQHQRAIAELRDECNTLRIVAGSVCGERDTLRQQIAEQDAAIEEWSGTAVQNGMECDRLAANLDKLAGLLADVKADYTHAIHWEDLHSTMKRIDAALAEVNK